MATSQENISEFVRNNQGHGCDPNAISRMSRMLLIDKTITDISIKDSTYDDWTALHYQACFGTSESVAWLLRQDPLPDTEVRDGCYQRTPLMYAAYSNDDPEGKVRLLLEHGADRDAQTTVGDTALSLARLNNKPAAVNLLVNYRPDISR
jgi:ankyrin repeat protein